VRNKGLYIFFGMLISFIFVVLYFFKQDVKEREEQCVERGGVFVSTGRSYYICMSKESLR
jgi:hypothetical protein